MADKTEFEAVLKTAQSAREFTVNGSTVFAHDASVDLTDMENFMERPRRMRGHTRFRDTKSLAAYLERFEQPHSIAFSDPVRHTIEACIDWHDHNEQLPNHVDHKASFIAQKTAEYQAWVEVHKKPMSQVAAGMFLEERAVDVIEPDAASIMDMVMQFDALKRVTFRQSTRLHDGQRQFTYSEESEARGAVTLPERIKIRVPVFDGQEPDVIPIRVKYRIEDGSLKFTFEIHDRSKVETTAFERCEDALAKETSILMLRVA